MPILLNSKIVRLAINAASYAGFTDQLTNAPVQFPLADLRIEAGFFYGKVNGALQLVDLSNWVSVTCSLRAPTSNGGAPAGDAANLAQKTVLAAALNPTLTAEQWAAFTHQHVAFDFTEAEINNCPVGNVWCVFTALLASGKVIPLQFGLISAVQDGYASAGTTAAAAGTSYTKAEALALFGTYVPSTALTGGAAGALDALPTLPATSGALPTGSLRSAIVGGVLSWWQLTAGTAAENAAGGIVRPDDYATTTNEKNWIQRA